MRKLRYQKPETGVAGAADTLPSCTPEPTAGSCTRFVARHLHKRPPISRRPTGTSHHPDEVPVEGSGGLVVDTPKATTAFCSRDPCSGTETIAPPEGTGDTARSGATSCRGLTGGGVDGGSGLATGRTVSLPCDGESPRRRNNFSLVDPAGAVESVCDTTGYARRRERHRRRKDPLPHPRDELITALAMDAFLIIGSSRSLRGSPSTMLQGHGNTALLHPERTPKVPE